MNEGLKTGIDLRQAREQRGLSIADVAHHTRISAGILEALENNDYSVFSSLAYAKGFLLQYSDFLQVDAHRALAAFVPVDPLSNLEAYDYLKIHTERLRSKPQPEPEPLPELTPDAPPAKGMALQALALVLITVVLVGAVFYTIRTVEQRGAPEALNALAALRHAAQDALDGTLLDPPDTQPQAPGTPTPTIAPDPDDAIATSDVPRAIIVREP